MGNMCRGVGRGLGGVRGCDIEKLSMSNIEEEISNVQPCLQFHPSSSSNKDLPRRMSTEL